KGLLRFDDVKFLLVNLYTKLKILDTSFDDKTSCEHTKGHNKVNNVIVVEYIPKLMLFTPVLDPIFSIFVIPNFGSTSERSDDFRDSKSLLKKYSVATVRRPTTFQGKRLGQVKGATVSF
ncbi:hypothetical protein Tco_1231545, partial [Tanacetum coccineum]